MIYLEGHEIRKTGAQRPSRAFYFKSEMNVLSHFEPIMVTT